MTHNPARARTGAALALAALLAVPPLAPVRANVGEEAGIGEAPVTTTWYALLSPSAQEADRAYVAGMRPHHAGALTMSREYLADPGRSSPLLQALARAIVVNQSHEIGVLDEVSRNLERPPLRLFGLALQPVATEGLADRLRFFKTPIPSPLAVPIGPVSRRDVQFAKAMTIHHEGALEMARAYHANPAARNGFLGLLNVDIIADQSQEIALMRQVIAAYPGDAAQVKVPPSMIHGMEHMSSMTHGMGHMGHGGHGAAEPAGEGHGVHAAPVAPPGAAPRRSAATAARPRPATAPRRAPAAAAEHSAHHH